jgi:hypothetical protein
MYTALRIVRGIIGLVLGWQIIGLLPIITWLQDTSSITGNMIAALVLKVVLIGLFGAAFFGMRWLINKIHTKRHGVPHPALSTKAFAL